MEYELNSEREYVMWKALEEHFKIKTFVRKSIKKNDFTISFGPSSLFLG